MRVDGGVAMGFGKNNIFVWNPIYYLVLLGIIPIIPIMFDIPMIYGVSIGNSNRLQDGFSIHRKSESQF
jgi:hypothetical protein